MTGRGYDRKRRPSRSPACGTLGANQGSLIPLWVGWESQRSSRQARDQAECGGD